MDALLSALMRFRRTTLLLAVAAFGIVAIVLGIYHGWRAIDLVRTGDRVEGRVVDVHPDEGSDDRFEPEYEYRVDGESYRHHQTNPSVKPRPELGARRELIVDRDGPRDVTIPSFTGLWATPLTLVVFGLLARWALWYRLVRPRRRRPGA
jgi:hypothetical protein